MINVVVHFHEDRNQPYTAHAINGKTRYDWKTGLTEIEALTRLRATYISWQNIPFEITRIKDQSL